MDVIVEPLAEATLRRGSCWARFLAQGLTDPELSDVVRRCFEAGPYRDARQRLVDALTDVPDELRERRVDHAVGTLVMSLAATEALTAAGGRAQLPISAQISDLVDICTAILEAPASSTTRAALAARRRRPA
jgi:hypothetical protein